MKVWMGIESWAHKNTGFIPWIKKNEKEWGKNNYFLKLHYNLHYIAISFYWPNVEETSLVETCVYLYLNGFYYYNVHKADQTYYTYHSFLSSYTIIKMYVIALIMM